MRTVVNSSPDRMFRVVPVSDSNLPTELKPVSSRIPPGSFLIFNDTDSPIMTIIAKWSFTDSTGKAKQLALICDGFAGIPHRTMVEPHEYLLMTPRGCAASSVFSRLASGTTVGTTLDTPNLSVATWQSLSDIYVDVDAVIFNNGEIRGTDSYAYSKKIADRHGAQQAIVKELADSPSNEESSARLDKVRLRVGMNQDSFSQSMAEWARRLKHSPNINNTLKVLSTQTIPSFRHTRGDE